jgi:pimeloyl-ACP methyl ester carboxylesterase
MPLATTLTSDIAFMIAEACVAEPAYKQDAYLLDHLMICEGRPAEEAREMAALQRRRYETDDFQEHKAAAERLNNNEYCKLIGLNNPAFSSEDKFKARDKSPSRLGSYFDAMPLVAAIRFPVLALFGEKDNNIDPGQGVEAYRHAFKTAAHPVNRVEIVPNANHMLYEAKTGCARELLAQVAEGKPRYGSKVLAILAEWLESLKKHLRA